MRVFAASLPDRPLREDTDAYTPKAMGLPVLWEGPAEIRWSFGDGSPEISTGERASASHVYEDQGKYVVTVTARDKPCGVYATGKLEIEVTNRDPAQVEVAAVEVEPGTSTLELTASAQDAAGDDLEYEWRYGDGDTAKGGDDLRRVRHRYLLPGTYTVTLHVRDREGGEKVAEKKVSVGGGAPATGSKSSELGDEERSSAVETRLTGSLSGAVEADLSADVRSLRGLYLSKVESGACRFVFSAWDDANLAYLYAVVDLFGVPPAGARFEVERPRVALVLVPTAEAYAAQKTGSFGRLGTAGFASLLEEVPDDLSEVEKEKAGARVGVDLTPRAASENVAMPARSPLGITQRRSFMTQGGRLDLTFVPGERAEGRFALVLEQLHGKEKGQTVRLDASLALDLAAARRDGIVRYDGCEPAPFEITRVWPKDGTEQVILARPGVSVTFDASFDPATLDEKTFQVTYPGDGWVTVPVAGRILRDERKALFVPDAPLLPGVRYTARIKTGDSGVRSRAGSPLADDDGSGWRVWRFSTKVDMVPITDGDRLLACHLFQTSRDAPLVLGKPAVARVYASWERQLGVRDDAQLEEVSARIVLRDGERNELAAKWHTFVRPDLWEQKGLETREREHTAEITGIVPVKGLPGPLYVDLQVRLEPGSEQLVTAYSAACPLALWGRSPSLTLDFVALPFAEWTDPAEIEERLPALERIAKEVEDFAWQLYPVARIERTPVRLLPFPAGYRMPAIGDDCPPGCLMTGAGNWWTGFDAWLRSKSTADVVIAFGPRGVREGGSTGGKLAKGRGAILWLVTGEEKSLSNDASAITHELGHVFGLEHIPFIPDGPDAKAKRKAADDSVRKGTVPFWYRGIEGLRMSRDGKTVRNKSGVEGNEEDTWLAPFMFLGAFPKERWFIENHHYRQVQRLFEDLGR